MKLIQRIFPQAAEKILQPTGTVTSSSYDVRGFDLKEEAKLSGM